METAAVEVVDAKEARERILAKKVRRGLTVEGKLDLTQAPQLKSLPAGLSCFELDASGSALETLPADLQVECKLTLQNCPNLKSLPENLKVGTLDVRGCTALTELPEGLDVWFLIARDCVRLQAFPRQAAIQNGGLALRNCPRITALPGYLKKLATLDVSDCPRITELPPALQVGQWIDVGGSGIAGLTENTRTTGIRWRGVPIDERIAFRPHEIKSREVLAEKNAERRRVMIERMGPDKFMNEAGARTLDQDTDAGGVRLLLHLPLEGDEDMVCLSVSCPSTGRKYLLRVPPTMTGCRQAAAWMAGFDDPAKYQPVKET